MKLQDMIIKTIDDGKERNINRRKNLDFGIKGALGACWHVSFKDNIFLSRLYHQ